MIESGEIPPTVFGADTNVPKLREILLKRKIKWVASKTKDEETYIEEDIQIPVRDGITIGVRIHKPATPPADGSPIFVMYHGGGFCVGGVDNETLLLRRWAQLGGVAVNVDYRLAPEHQFPIPANDAYDALKWTAANFESLGGNPKKGFFVGGISAGANFASVLSLLYLKEQHTPRLTGVYLSILPCMHLEAVPEKYKHLYLSREQNAEAPSLNVAGMTMFGSKLLATQQFSISLTSTSQITTTQTTSQNSIHQWPSLTTKTYRRPSFRFAVWTLSATRLSFTSVS